ncbi:MAG: hypothetical protein NTV06_10380 [candidate division Zixibacteria bacterium]|nr:hypothetical protein [candidate division Zixibacteria bacterium]
MKLGAFNTNFQLSAGDQGMAVKVPLVISHEVGFEKQRLIANLIKGNKILASDTAYLKIADFDVKTSTKIALLPDSSGLLEDILVMTKANYRTISDRFLIDGDLDLYDLVILGTGCLKQYKSLEFSSEKLRKYMEFGGQVLVFGQPDNWRNDLLPVSIIPTQNRLAATDLELTEPKQAIFKTGYEIDVSALLQRINVNYFSYPAVIFPAEKIITGRDKVTLLSISKFGRGRFIYCGIPLLEMFGDLDTDAIKLFSNLINYSGS